MTYDPSNPFWLAALQSMMQANSPVGKAILDRNFRYLFINESLASYNGKSVQAHLGCSVAEVLPDAFPLLEPLLKRVLNGEAQTNFRIKVATPELSEWEASYLPIYSANGSVDGIYVQAVNLTAKIQAELALANSEKRLRRILDNLLPLVMLLDTEGRIIEANPAPLRASGLDLADVKGKAFWDIGWWTDSAQAQNLASTLLERVAQGETIRQDIVIHGQNSNKITIDMMISPLRDESGVVRNIIVSGNDISERQEARLKIEAALRDRTILLQEVHHRVKNNLQIIVSLLRLQARSAHPQAQQALLDCQNRVIAMSLTHQLLYEKQDFSSIELGNYLKRLVANLRDSNGSLNQTIEIELESSEQGLNIGLNQSVPIVLIVNELIVNAIKHGFPEGESGLIKVQAKQEKDLIIVTVSDNGKGLDAGVQLESMQTLGFNLVRLLADQLGAKIIWPEKGGSGTVFKIEIPKIHQPI